MPLADEPDKPVPARGSHCSDQRNIAEMAMIYAHSVKNRPESQWEGLDAHLAKVSVLAARFASIFGWQEAARAAGLLHDIGKVSLLFQDYLCKSHVTKGPDHSTAGAREAAKFYPKQLGRMLAYIIAGHHAGLSDFADLDRMR